MAGIATTNTVVTGIIGVVTIAAGIAATKTPYG
jgi:hypothetical protein